MSKPVTLGKFWTDDLPCNRCGSEQVKEHLSESIGNQVTGLQCANCSLFLTSHLVATTDHTTKWEDY